MVPNKRGISQSGDQEIMGLITAGSLFECSFVDPLLRLFKPSRVIKKHGAGGRGLISLCIYTENFKIKIFLLETTGQISRVGGVWGGGGGGGGGGLIFLYL